MPVKVNKRTYYRTSEVCARVGVSRATLFRWLKAGVVGECGRDRRGWRLFTSEELARIRSEVNKVKLENRP